MHDSTPIGQLSEREILARIAVRTGRASAAEIAIGDDAAVIASSGRVVATTDTLIDGPDFRLAWTTGYDLGWKAAAVNLADIAAMGATPTALIVALAMPNDTEIGFVEAMADGLREACEALAPGCGVVGGDLTQSATLMVAVTALGDMDGREPVRRAGAGVGDVVAIAGEMGVAARGLEVLFTRFCDVDGHATPIDRDQLESGELRAIEMQLRPKPPLGLGPVAAMAGATAMMDVSDGLALDASRLAESSGVTIDFESAALGSSGDLARALRGGEDHALLATFSTDDLAPGFRAIGRVVAAQPSPVLVDGEPYTGETGWDPYSDWNGQV
ncbi:thiamine-phosphate kinase [Microbacterium amylolyticum]|uniref:Thiamine-monophosphate kinase n=1 Tax=Microbacterium amylolyticum TaxID=936337 RepID=A0ABS4ZEY1_9MICO|nr:thiamine-phosphate kinase [Microbacterium amylolyticum]MBP2435850.1 thiamine-monophosphate kinase [Microbacterium amylolyticum]